MELAFVFIFGIVIGLFAAGLMALRIQVGTLRIDHSNSEKDTYLFEIDDLDKISEKEFVILRVDNYADLSQK